MLNPNETLWGIVKREMLENKNEIMCFFLVDAAIIFLLSSVIWKGGDFHLPLISVIARSTFAPLLEEVIFRLPIFLLIKETNVKIANLHILNVVIAAIFAMTHPWYANKAFIFTIGLYFGNFVIRKKVFFPSVLMHGAHNLFLCLLLL